MSVNIKSKVVSEERKLAFARGTLSTLTNKTATTAKPAAAPAAKKAPPAPTDDADDSDTSSDSDVSTASSAKKGKQPLPVEPAKKTYLDPTEDYAAYSKRAAAKEWLYATGQAGGMAPIPPTTAASKNVRVAPAVAAAPAAVEQSPLSKRFTVAPAAVASSPKGTIAATASPATTVTPTKVTVSPAVSSAKKDAAKAAGKAPLEVAPVVVEPKAYELVTEKEEESNPGRRDFLKLLDMLDTAPRPTTAAATDKEDEEKAKKLAAAVPAKKEVALRPAAGIPFATLKDQEYDRLYEEWLNDDVERPFMALENMEKAHSLALIREHGGSFDPSGIHAMYRHQVNVLKEMQASSNRFSASCQVLEALVVNDRFVAKINGFLNKHHKEFLATKVSRERGEFSHSEFLVYRKYSAVAQELVIGELKSEVEDFDADEFFTEVFDTPAGSIDESDSAPALSFEVWEVLLSFLKFENFCELMDEYIAVYYSVQPESSSGSSKVAAGLRGVKKRTPPPSNMSESPVSSSASSAAGSKSAPEQKPRGVGPVPSASSTSSKSSSTASKSKK